MMALLVHVLLLSIMTAASNADIDINITSYDLRVTSFVFIACFCPI